MVQLYSLQDLMDQIDEKARELEALLKKPPRWQDLEPDIDFYRDQFHE